MALSSQPATTLAAHMKTLASSELGQVQSTWQHEMGCLPITDEDAGFGRQGKLHSALLISALCWRGQDQHFAVPPPGT